MTAIEFLTGIESAYNNYMSSGELEYDIMSSTKAGWNGGSYSVELFPNGHYRGDYSDRFGNRYDSPGIILVVPQCTDSEIDDDEDLWYYDNAVEAFEDTFLGWKAEFLEYEKSNESVAIQS